MAKDIKASAALSGRVIRANATLSGNPDAEASLGQTVVTGGTTDYKKLRNKPRIEGVELVGDLTFPQLNMSKLTNSEIEALLQ